METTRIKIFDNIKKYNKVILVTLFSTLLYYLAATYNSIFNEIMPVASFLTWHNMFELTSIFISFSIFTITYFMYDETKSLKMILYGCAFLYMGSLDVFHTLSYKGMPDFFVENFSANMPTTFWVLARLVGSIIFLKGLTLSANTISNIKKEVFLTITGFSVFVSFYIVTYIPSLFPPMYIEGLGLTNFKIILEYFIISILLLSLITALLQYNKTNSKKLFTFIIAFVLLIFSEFTFTKYGSTYDAYAYLGHIYKIIAYGLFYNAIYLENVTLPFRHMKQTKNELKLYSENLNEIVKQRTFELEGSNAELLMDMEYAKEMQRCLLPLKMPKNSFVSFSAEYMAAKDLSGDFYNVINLDENNIAIYIGDVSGHGISAAMLTVFAYQNVVQLKEKSFGQIIEPGFVLKTIYKSFNRTNINDEKYIVMLYGIYNIKDKSFNYASAGINVQPYVLKESGQIGEMNVNGFPICKLGDLVSPYYDNRSIQLEIGDKILFYSDGLVEAKNENGKVYGNERLKQLLTDNSTLNPSDLKTIIKNDFYKHIGFESELMDDVTFLLMKVNK